MTSNTTMRALQRFANHLGWRGKLRAYRHTIPKDDEVPADLRGKVIVWYEFGKATGTRSDCFLQINASIGRESRHYKAGVIARRYGMFTGWHEFWISASDVHVKREADRVSRMLARKWFATPENRRALRAVHPEFSKNLPWRLR